MRRLLSETILVLAALALSVPSALAQNVPPAVARATIESVSSDGATLAVRTRRGEESTVRLNPKTRFVRSPT